MTASEWTIDTLKEHLEAMLAAERELRRARREDDQLAAQRAQKAMDQRLATMNDIREQLRVQREEFLPRETYDTSLAQWSEWRTTVDNHMALGVGRQAGVSATGKLISGLIAAAVGVITLVVIVVNLWTSPQAQPPTVTVETPAAQSHAP